MDVDNGLINALLELQPDYVYTAPANGLHSFVAGGSPIFGRTYGAVIPPVPPTDIDLAPSGIPENEPTGTLVGTLTSQDQNRNETFTYSLVSGAGDTDNARFQIVGDQLFALETFDFEANQSFTIRIASTDSTNLVYEEAVVISVVNVNEDPLDINLSPSNVDENSANGRYVGTFSTIDTDVLTDFVFNYQLVSGAGDTHNSSFAIVNGNLEVAGPIDFETTPTMSIRVRTTDLGGLFYEEILTIDINNVNETTTQINLSNA